MKRLITFELSSESDALSPTSAPAQIYRPGEKLCPIFIRGAVKVTAIEAPCRDIKRKTLWSKNRHQTPIYGRSGGVQTIRDVDSGQKERTVSMGEEEVGEGNVMFSLRERIYTSGLMNHYILSQKRDIFVPPYQQVKQWR